MCSSRKTEAGFVEVTHSGDVRYPVGTTFIVVGSIAEAGRPRLFDDYLARLTLSQSGRPWGEGVRVLPPEGALSEAISQGLIHESLVEALRNPRRPALKRVAASREILAVRPGI